jgi:PleD family two-component response regulator
MERALTGAGYEVFTEERGDKTALRITEERPDVVLLDLSMPIMDGFQVLRQIKGNPLTRGVSIIVLGEEMNRDVYSASMTLGARDLIVKPWHPGDLQLRVHRAFEASRARMKQAERAANRAKTRLRISVNGKERSRSRAGNRNVRPVGNR